MYKKLFFVFEMVEFSETVNKGIAWSIIIVLCLIVILMIVGFIMNYCLEKQIEAHEYKYGMRPNKNSETRGIIGPDREEYPEVEPETMEGGDFRTMLEKKLGINDTTPREEYRKAIDKEKNKYFGCFGAFNLIFIVYILVVQIVRVV